MVREYNHINQWNKSVVIAFPWPPQFLKVVLLRICVYSGVVRFKLSFTDPAICAICPKLNTAALRAVSGKIALYR